MRLFATSGFVVMLASVLAVGLRLLWVGRRTRGAPELAIGTACLTLAAGGLTAHAIRSIGPANAIAFPVMAASQLVIALGCVALGFGLWRIYRPASRVAPVACALLGVIALAGWAPALRHGVPMNPLDPTPENLVLSLVRLGVYSWAAVEGFQYNAKLRRRLALGLADPLIANQFLLWGISGGLSALGSGVLLFTSFGLGINGVEWPPSALFLSVSGGASGVALWCAFFPPAALRRRIAGKRTGDFGSVSG